jgi:hypothetical protein
MQIWLIRLIYALILYTAGIWALGNYAFNPKSITVTERVTNERTRKILNILVRSATGIITVFIGYFVIFPIYRDTVGLFCGEKVNEKYGIIEDANSGYFPPIERGIYLKGENESYSQVFAFDRAPQRDELVKVYYLPRSRTILRLEFMPKNFSSKIQVNATLNKTKSLKAVRPRTEP